MSEQSEQPQEPLSEAQWAAIRQRVEMSITADWRYTNAQAAQVSYDLCAVIREYDRLLAEVDRLLAEAAAALEIVRAVARVTLPFITPGDIAIGGIARTVVMQARALLASTAAQARGEAAEPESGTDDGLVDCPACCGSGYLATPLELADELECFYCGPTHRVTVADAEDIRRRDRATSGEERGARTNGDDNDRNW